MIKIGIPKPNNFSSNKNNIANLPKKISFSSRARVIPTDIKKIIHHTKRIENEMGQLRSYLQRFLAKNIDSLDVFKKLGIKKLDIHPHFIERYFQRLRNGRIEKGRSVLHVLQDGDVFTEKGFKGKILRGKAGLNLILDKNHSKWSLTSVYDSKKPFTTWIKDFNYTS